MLDGPLGAAAFNNEFGRPNICGYFRTFEQRVQSEGRSPQRGYHKPIMIAGGMGNIRRALVEKSRVVPGARIVVLGGPAMLIGLGGGAASSMGSGASSADLDFASVQRGNPEIQRRAQEVIDACSALGPDSPILLIHDVGAGGLSNAIPESVAHGTTGGRVDLRKVPSDEPGMSPLEIWCNEAQERYVLIVAEERLAAFGALCERERCPFSVVGEVTDDGMLHVADPQFGNAPVSLPLEVILGKPPKMTRDVRRLPHAADDFDGSGIDVREAALRVLRLPAVADKTFLVTIGDRSVGGMISRDPMVGPWQVPVSDVAVTVSDYFSSHGEAMAMGERTPLALLDAAASGRMAVAEAITNIAAADIRRIEDVRLSANWMAACGEPGEDADLFDTVRAVGEEFCPALGIAIPVGKDSLSMKTAWTEEGEQRKVVAPVSLIVSAFAPAEDVRRTLTPQLRTGLRVDTSLVLVDLAAGRNRLGGSCLAQVYGRIGREPPDCEDPARLKAFFKAIGRLRHGGLALAYHDRSDGGLFVTLCEMAFAGRCGVEVDLAGAVADTSAMAALFAEELGAVLQVESGSVPQVLAVFRESGLEDCARVIGRVTGEDRVTITRSGRPYFAATRTELRKAWSETTLQMQSLRDNPACAREEHRLAIDATDPGLFVRLPFDPEEDVAAPYVLKGARPEVAILREQGVNSQLEMAAAFHRAGFRPSDVHMTDLIAGRVRLDKFKGLVACGGFSYGDVLGAGEGWAKSILFNARVREEFAAFFARRDSFSLGVCNGCQMMSALKPLIPGADHWPRFVRNRSEQFEGRFSLVEVLQTPSLFFTGMAGSVLPIAVAHGEGRAEFASAAAETACSALGLVGMRFVDSRGQPARTYPENPNGSPGGITGLTTVDGRVTILMPHPERVYRTVQNSWHPDEWGEDGGWMRMFRNARVWVG
jgi:phosphoribosylformylglycinamidine synthase